MGCRGCAGTAGYLLRDCGSVGPQPLPYVFLLCGHDSVSPHTVQETCPACACGQKITLRTPRWRPSRASAPHRKTRPAAQRSGGHQGVATRKATGVPATHGGAGDPACEQEQCVGTCDRGLEEGAAHRRCELLRYAASYGQRLLAQPLRVTCLLLGIGPSFLSSSSRHQSSCYHGRGEDVVKRFVMGSGSRPS